MDADAGPTTPELEGTVPSNARVQSARRGVSAGGNDYPTNLTLTQSDLDVLAPGVSWFYNWAASSSVLDAQERMEFLPTAWGRPGDIGAVQTWLASHPDTTVVLAANEPNRGDQANLTAAATAEYIQAVRAIAGQRPVIGPHLAASATVTTYRNEVATALGGLPATAIHIYDPGAAGFNYWATGWPHQDWPSGITPPATVWVKELNIGDPAGHTEDETIAHMIYAVDVMERDPRVVKYAWWKDRRRFGGEYTIPPTHFLLSNTANGELTALGDLYVHMPVHAPMLWYAVPGRLEAERYVRISGTNVALRRTGDAKLSPSDLNGDGRIDVTVPNDQWIEYNLDIAAGTHTLELRLDGSQASTVEVSVDGTVLGTITTTAGAGFLTTAPIAVELPEGRNVLRLRTTSGTARVNWLRVN